MSRILVIDGHPNSQSLCAALAEHYAERARAAGAQVEVLCLRDLAFDPVLRPGAGALPVLEPDLLRAQALIRDSGHICVVAPVWWGSVPALLKGFFDRTLEKGWAYRYHANGIPEGLLKGRRARVLMTTDSPGWYLRWLQGNPTANQLVHSTLKFCGLKPVTLSRFGPVHSSTPALRQRWLVQAGEAGAADALALR
ncbi:NAD(P)H-dependent oxidoreductase [Hydrogenophaga sp.]|uniref:NAD(P)H-dependent oxidoreductase n=1 Tax=Hydrogenophaga sp. TaxID=1904254 RepID=UPI003569B422